MPTDSADASSRRRYRAFEESRRARTLAPQGERRTLFAPDLVGPSEQIIERLVADAVVGEVDELRLELPYEFSDEEYEQILHDVATLVAPALGWTPTTSRDSSAGATGAAAPGSPVAARPVAVVGA